MGLDLLSLIKSENVAIAVVTARLSNLPAYASRQAKRKGERAIQKPIILLVIRITSYRPVIADSTSLSPLAY